MSRGFLFLTYVLLGLGIIGCGGSASNPASGGNGGGGTPQEIPTLASIAPSAAAVGTVGINLELYGANFESGATVQWNGNSLSSVWVSSTQMTATVPDTDLATTGSAKITVVNPGPGGGMSLPQTFTITDIPPATTIVRSVTGISTAQDIVWDAAHFKLYVSVPPIDPVTPNSVVPIDPVNASAGTPILAGNNPNRLTVSSDSAYLWVGLDGDNKVQRLLLPGLSKDISFTLPLDFLGNAQRPVDLQAAPVNPHTVALVSENINLETGQGVYVYDDATRRPAFVPGSTSPGGALIDWIQWGKDDSTIYASQSLTVDAGGIATLSVNPSGVSLASYNGGQVGPTRFIQYDKGNGRLYSDRANYNPVDGALIGQYAWGLGERTCTGDSSVGRYYCFFAIQDNSVTSFQLWIYDLNSYALIDRLFFGFSSGTHPSSITGSPVRLIRWGNAGLALITDTDLYRGTGGVYLIDGAAVNPKSAPDFTSGTPIVHLGFLASLSPQAVPAGSPDLNLTIEGSNFTLDSTACWNCNYLQFQFLPTTYVNSNQLRAKVPASLLANTGQLPITVFDSSSNLFSNSSLTLIVDPPSASGGTTKVQAINLAGLAMDRDPISGVLYVGTAEYDGMYPNSIVVIDGTTGEVVKAQTVGSNPDLVSVSASGQYIYAAYADATTMTQLHLPELGSANTWTLHNPQNSAVYWAGDLKAAPQSPHTTAVNLLNLESDPDQTGGVVIYDDNIERQNFVPGWGSTTNLFDTIAWGASDQILTAACLGTCFYGDPASPLYDFQVSQSGATLAAKGSAAFNLGELHSDSGTGLIYSDDGNVADPTTQAIVGSYNASGLVVPDSSLNRVFILGQTAAQANTNNFTIQSFDQKAYTLVSSIILTNLVGSPLQLARWGTSGLAVLTSNAGQGLPSDGSPGMLYLIRDSTFVSSAQAVQPQTAKPKELAKLRWKRLSRADLAKFIRDRGAMQLLSRKKQ